MESPRPHLIGLAAGLSLATGIVFASIIVGSAWTRIADPEVISVTGSARKNVRSDMVFWRASFSTDADSLLDAQKQLSQDLGKVESFMRNNAVKQYEVLPVEIHEITAHVENDKEGVPVRIGYRLSRTIEVRSNDIDGMPKLSNDSNELLQQGVAFASEKLEYLYTKAGEAKVEMMAEATKDARARAEQIATQGGRKLKTLRAAKVGVIQINPMYSTATSSEGNNDTTSPDKTITATIAATFSLK